MALNDILTVYTWQMWNFITFNNQPCLLTFNDLTTVPCAQLYKGIVHGYSIYFKHIVHGYDTVRAFSKII